MLTDDECELAALEEEVEGVVAWAESDLPEGAQRLARSVRDSVLALVAEVRRLRAAPPGPASTSMLAELSRMTGERFGRATLTGAGSQ